MVLMASQSDRLHRLPRTAHRFSVSFVLLIVIRIFITVIRIFIGIPLSTFE
jgi:hypothetical protein